MHLKVILLKWLKLFGGDTRQAVVGYVVLALILASGGIFSLSKTALSVSLRIVNTSTPLWLIIILMVVVLIIYLKAKKAHSSQNLELQAVFIEKALQLDNTIDALKKRIEALEKHLELDGISMLNKEIKKLNSPDI
jgi:hypothetical protein